MTTDTQTDFAICGSDGDHAPCAYTDADLRQLALEAGVPNSTWSFPPELRAFAELLVERCASIGDRYTDAEGHGNAGEEIRAAFGLC
jgi:hypothetical protein